MSAEEKSDAGAQIVLAHRQYKSREFAACERTLEELVARVPGEIDLATYRLLAKLKAANSGPDSARAVMQGALRAHPGRTEFIAAYAEMLPAEEAIAVLAQHLTEVRGDPGRSAYLLLRMTSLRAPLARRAQGLPDYGLSWRDTLQWPDAEALPELRRVLQTEVAMGSKRATARLDLAYIAMAEGDWEAAERFLAELRAGPKRTPADFTAFGADFHAGLDAKNDAEIFQGLAPVQRLLAPPVTGAIVYMASDPTYFTTFTLPFLRQLEAAAVPINVQIHLLDGNEPEWSSVRQRLETLTHVRATLTAEASGAAAQGSAPARTYYHAMRYVRFYGELLQAQIPMWMLDCDVQLLRDPRPLFSFLGSYDLALRTTPYSFEPVLKITASCVGVAPTPAGLEFARRVAATIVHWKTRGTWNWGVDQLALISAYAHMSAQGREPKTLFLDNAAINDKVGDTGVVRFLSGIDKYVAGSSAA